MTDKLDAQISALGSLIQRLEKVVYEIENENEEKDNEQVSYFSFYDKPSLRDLIDEMEKTRMDFTFCCGNWSDLHDTAQDILNQWKDGISGMINYDKQNDRFYLIPQQMKE